MRKLFWAPDSDSATRAEQSQSSGRPDLFTGVDIIDGRVKAFNGVVWGVEDLGEKAPSGQR
jgi:hypothetical protein